jgi:hypothetical protein
LKYLCLILLLVGSSSFACVNIDGKYLINEKFVIQYTQNSCLSLTEKWCTADGTKCGAPDGSGTTWLLDGVMRTEGGNPSNWAAMTADAHSIHRTNSVDSGTEYEGNLCWWKELWYSKDAAGNLNVSFKLNCPDKQGNTKMAMLTQVWTPFK